jgi:hypothetical protein
LFNHYSPPVGFTWNEKLPFALVPRELTQELCRRPLEIREPLLPILEARKLGSSRMLVTVDENYGFVRVTAFINIEPGTI